MITLDTGVAYLSSAYFRITSKSLQYI